MTVVPSETVSRWAPWKDLIRSGGTKFIALGVSAVLGLIITRLIITNYGVEVFAQYGLLVGLGALIQINALGLSAPLVNAMAVSEDPGRDDELRRVILSALRVLTVTAVLLIIGVSVMTAAGWWGALLGDSLIPGSGPIAAALCMSLWAFGMPLDVGQRLLAGMSKNYLTILIGGVQSPIVLLVLVLTLENRGPAGPFIPVVSYAATLIAGVVCFIIAARMIRPTLMRAVSQVPRRKRFPGARILDQAGPMSIIMVALAVAIQTDRIILSHVASPDDLAQYNLAAQMYNPITAIVSAAGITLWPKFAAARAKNEDASPVRLSLIFGGIGTLLAIGVTLISPFLAQFASGGMVSFTPLLIITFSLLMIVQALQYPYGMYLTDKRGLRFQATMIVMMLPVNLLISWALGKSLGAAGPVIGTVICITLFQLLANMLYVKRANRLRTTQPEGAP